MQINTIFVCIYHSVKYFPHTFVVILFILDSIFYVKLIVSIIFEVKLWKSNTQIDELNDNNNSKWINQIIANE